MLRIPPDIARLIREYDRATPGWRNPPAAPELPNYAPASPPPEWENEYGTPSESHHRPDRVR